MRKLAPLIVLGRAGITKPTTGPAPAPLLPELSSTHVRELAARKVWDELAPIVPRAVVDYVRTRGLYG